TRRDARAALPRDRAVRRALHRPGLRQADGAERGRGIHGGREGTRSGAAGAARRPRGAGRGDKRAARRRGRARPARRAGRRRGGGAVLVGRGRRTDAVALPTARARIIRGMLALAIVFWTCVALLVHTHVLYPASLWLLSRLRKRRQPDPVAEG